MGDHIEEDTKMIPKDETEPKAQKEKAVWPYMTIGSFTTSMLIRAAAVGAIWSWGYMHWSFAWLIPPVFFSIWKMESHKNSELKRLTAQASVMAKEKEVIINRLDELPSWVYFPDFDRAEWLNRVLYKVWPGMNHFVRNLVKESIQPAIAQALSEYKMPAIKFERLVLGRIPPKVFGIKVYEKNTSRNEIIMDCDILYAGDCDITFFLGSIKGGIRDFQIRGMIRVIMKPMLTFLPLVGGVQAYFLNNPLIDFNLVGAADILEFPGFNQVLRKVVKEQIAAVMVLPNKIIIPLTPEIPAEVLRMPEPEGILRIHVVQAKHLMKKDFGVLGKGKSDPYAIISVGAQEFRTKTIDNTVDPKWDYWCECAVTSAIAQQMALSVWDKDETKTDESLGRAVIEVNRVKRKGMIDNWFSLENAKHGMVQLRLTWLTLTQNKADLQAALMETQQLRVTSMSSAVLLLYIDSASNLPTLKSSKQPDVYLEASVGNKVDRTRTILRSCDPIWEQGFTLLVANPETNVLTIKIIDEKSGTTIATLQYSLATLLMKSNLEDMRQPYDLQSSDSNCKLIMSLALRILKYEEPEMIVDNDDEEPNVEEIDKKIERQESSVSSNGASEPSTPLKKQPSKESIVSLPPTYPSSAKDQALAALAHEKGEITEEIAETEEILISSDAPDNLTARPGLVHRHSSVSSSAGEWNLGRIQLTFNYQTSGPKLDVTIEKIVNLPLNDPHNIPDPYVKMYLLPDRQKETKRKSTIKKDICNPIFQEKFNYTVSRADMNTRILQVSVCTKKGWLSSGDKVMGQVHVNLAEIDTTGEVTRWYDLKPEIKD